MTYEHLAKEYADTRDANDVATPFAVHTFARWLDARQAALEERRPKIGYAQPADLMRLADQLETNAAIIKPREHTIALLRAAAQEIAFERAYIDGLHYTIDSM